MSDQKTASPAGIILLCGRSFSGKSTLAGGLAERLGASVVSLDSINAERGLQSGAGVPVSEWIRTHEVARERTSAAVARGATVIIDDTSSPRFLRDDWRALADRLDTPFVLIYVDVPADVSLQRHASNRAEPRRMDVTEAILREHLPSFEEPAPDEQFIPYSGLGSDLESTLNQVRSRIGLGSSPG